MPKRTDIKRILIIGSGPIVIGQACEFDYSGTQGCKALMEEGYEVILANSNPATIMTDPQIGYRTYIEPLIPEVIRRIIEREKPDALLPTLGGQTALNLAVELAESGFLERMGCRLIGASLEAIKKAERRDLFKKAMERIGEKVPLSGLARSMAEANEMIKDIGFPAIIRPSFTLGGTGAGTAYNIVEYQDVAHWGLKASPVGEILVEQSILGWKEFELEVMRDHADNVVIICSIENFDPVGIHTGDSITVAPAQTLTDREYQEMRNAAIAIIREIGVDTGGSNIQFGVHPQTGERLVIEMNPRVSRSSALASKATGFPIAKIAAKLAVGYRLDEIPNDITRETPASFEPTIDYCVTKIPRWNFEKFRGADDTLGTQMKSVGEAMAIGRNFKESFQKGIRSPENGRYGLHALARIEGEKKGAHFREILIQNLSIPKPERIFYIREAFLAGFATEEIYERTKIDKWFLENIRKIVEFERTLASLSLEQTDTSMFRDRLLESKKMGFSDVHLARLLGTNEEKIRETRKRLGVTPIFKTVDTCAAEFEAETPYYYSCYESPVRRNRQWVLESEADTPDKPTIMILGSGPNRIGQGIEFDYCCCHAVFALRDLGYFTIMVNSNPETVSTDYDTSDRLFFEPLTFEEIMNIVESQKPLGVIVQFGGQTPLQLALQLARAGVPIPGTSPDSIDLAENRRLFGAFLNRLGIRQPPGGTGTSKEEALRIALSIGFPVLVRPSYVLGGRAMEVVYDEKGLADYMERAIEASPERPVLIDRYLVNAIEVDVDAVSDGKDVYIGGIMEHIEFAGVHSGDSACRIPPENLLPETVAEVEFITRKLAIELKVCGLLNIQFSVTDVGVGAHREQTVYVLEVNPRASRTVPYVSKATGVELAKIAVRCMVGKSLRDQGIGERYSINHVAVKEAVFPFIKFRGVDPVLGPEMRSTGEVMGIAADFETAFARAEAAAGSELPNPDLKAPIFISVSEDDRPAIVEVARALQDLGWPILATEGTRKHICQAGVRSKLIHKIDEGRPNIIDRLRQREIALVINTPGREPWMYKDEALIRRTAVETGTPYITTIAAARAFVRALSKSGDWWDVRSLQEYLTDNLLWRTADHQQATPRSRE